MWSDGFRGFGSIALRQAHNCAGHSSTTSVLHTANASRRPNRRQAIDQMFNWTRHLRLLYKCLSKTPLNKPKLIQLDKPAHVTHTASFDFALQSDITCTDMTHPARYPIEYRKGPWIYFSPLKHNLFIYLYSYIYSYQLIFDIFCLADKFVAFFLLLLYIQN